jgi:hypothetical protein
MVYFVRMGDNRNAYKILVEEPQVKAVLTHIYSMEQSPY